jgi:hypothetical protein
MNGRVYDPRIGRFVSADPIVQAPFHSQSYNRYSYASNSPLSYTDPSGYKTTSSSNKLIDYATTAPPGQMGVQTTLVGYTGDYWGGTSTATVTYSAQGPSQNSYGYVSMQIVGAGTTGGRGNDPQGGKGGGAPGNGDNPPPEIEPPEVPGMCINYLQLGAGAVSFVFGGVQALEGTVSTIIGVVSIPVPLVDLTSAGLIFFGVVNMGWGYSSMRDGIGMMQSAFDHTYRTSTFGQIGQMAAGDTGEKWGERLTLAAGVAGLTKSGSGYVNQIGTRAGTAAAVDSAFYGVGQVGEAIGCN